jgi:hypothetical protein
VSTISEVDVIIRFINLCYPPFTEFTPQRNLILTMGQGAQSLVLLATLCGLFATVSTADNCRFAMSYTFEEIWNDPQAQEQFLSDVMYWEGNFAKNYIGLNVASGLTYDGHGLNVR